MNFAYFKSITCLAMVAALFLAFLNMLNIENINILGYGITRKLDIIDKDQVNLTESILKAIDNLTYQLENITISK